jgi:hypothetical protein
MFAIGAMCMHIVKYNVYMNIGSSFEHFWGWNEKKKPKIKYAKYES